MKKLNGIKAVLALVLPSLVTLNCAAGVANSLHDWSTESWNSGKDLCGPCHMAHGSDPANQFIPLWSHQTDTASFSPFVSPHGTTIRQPDGASRACLSCHDGTLAYNQLKGVTVGPPQTVLGDFVIGGNHDLRGDHPVSFTYQDAINNSPTNTLKLPTEVLTTTLTPANNLINSTVDSAFLRNGSVQCVSCHDVHRSRGDSGQNSDKSTLTTPGHNPLLVVSGLAQDGTGSGLCRSCHNK